MAKLGVITDGISTNFEHALKIMSENDLNQKINANINLK